MRVKVFEDIVIRANKLGHIDDLGLYNFLTNADDKAKIQFVIKYVEWLQDEREEILLEMRNILKKELNEN